MLCVTLFFSLTPSLSFLFFRKTSLFKNTIPKPKLALNCVGGQNAMDVARHLDFGGVMATYGSMSRDPVTISTSAFIFKNITFKGYWMTQWTAMNKDSEERKKMFNDLTEYMRTGLLKAPKHRLIPLSNFAEGIETASNVQGYTGYKCMLELSN